MSTDGSTEELWLIFPFLEIGVVKISPLFLDPFVGDNLFELRSEGVVTVGVVIELG